MGKRVNEWAIIGIFFLFLFVFVSIYLLQFEKVNLSPSITDYFQCGECAVFYGMQVESVAGNVNEMIIETTGARYVLRGTEMEMWRKIDPETNSVNPEMIARLDFDANIAPFNFLSGNFAEAKINSSYGEFTFYSDSLFTINASQNFNYTHTHLGNAELSETLSGMSANKIWAGPDGGSLHASFAGLQNLMNITGEPTFTMHPNQTSAHLVFPSKYYNFQKLYGQNSRPFVHFVENSYAMVQLLSGCDAGNCPLGDYGNEGIGVFVLSADNYDKNEAFFHPLLNSSETPVLLESGVMGYKYSNEALVREFISAAHQNGFKVITYMTSLDSPPRWVYPIEHPLNGTKQPIDVTLNWMREFKDDYSLDGWYLDGFYTGSAVEDYQNIKKIRADVGEYGVLFLDSSGTRWVENVDWIRQIHIENYVDYSMNEETQIEFEPMELIDWPASDERLEYTPTFDNSMSVYRPYFNNTNGSIMVPANQMDFGRGGTATAGFVEQYNPDYRNVYDAKIHYETFLDFYLENNPEAVVGSYLSGTDCRFKSNGYPRETLDCNLFPPEAFLFSPYGDQNRKRLEIRDDQARQIFQDNYYNEIVRRGRPFVYMDNIIHPGSGGWGNIGMKWENVTMHISGIRTRLNEKGIKLATNVAGSPYSWNANNYRDSDLLMNAVDGVSFELPFNWYWARPFLSKVQDEISVYERWFDQDKLILFIPNVAGNEEGELRVVAAMAMIIRDSGDSIFVARTYWKPLSIYEWIHWPAQYGRANGNVAFTEVPNGWTAERNFQNGKITVIHQTSIGNATVSFTLPGENYELIRPNMFGNISVNGAQVGYTPNATQFFEITGKKEGVDSMIFGKGFNEGYYEDNVVVSFSLKK